MEAVGIEPASDHFAPHGSAAITRNGMVGETLVNPGEPELENHPGARCSGDRDVENRRAYQLSAFVLPLAHGPKVPFANQLFQLLPDGAAAE